MGDNMQESTVKEIREIIELVLEVEQFNIKAGKASSPTLLSQLIVDALQYTDEVLPKYQAALSRLQGKQVVH